MKLALDPYMFRRIPLLELPALVAELGYEWIELSPREDFTPFWRSMEELLPVFELRERIRDYFRRWATPPTFDSP